jgi:hypothetical protein
MKKETDTKVGKQKQTNDEKNRNMKHTCKKSELKKRRNKQTT